MVGVLEAAARSAGFHDGLTTDAWAALMVQFDTVLEGRDPVIRRAVSLASLFRPGAGDGHAPFEVDRAAGMGERAAGDHRVVRLATIQATRAAARSATGTERLLLAGVERELLMVSPRPGPVEVALRRWTAEVAGAAAGMSPETALTVAWTQRAILRQGVGLLARHDVVDGVGAERLRRAVTASSAAWDEAYATWRAMVPRVPAAMDGLRRATVEVQLAVRDAPEVEVLDALARTGFGGNLVASLAVTALVSRPRSTLVQTATELEPMTLVETSFGPADTSLRPGPQPPSRAVATLARPVGEEPVPVSGSPDAGGLEAGRVGEVEQVVLADHPGLEALAKIRDVGVVAGAARAGVGEARAMVGEVSDAVLDRLVERGRQARTAIGEAGLPMVRHWAAKVTGSTRGDFAQDAVVALMEAAARWDPAKASWSTYAYASARFAFFAEMSRLAGRREFASDALGERSLPDAESRRIVGRAPTSPEDVAMAESDRSRALQLVALLEPQLREAVVARMGRYGEPAPTLAVVADSLGVSATTARNRLEQGIGQLRELAQRHEGTGTVGLRQLAVALRSIPPPARRPEGDDRRPSTGGASVTPSCV